MADVKLTEQQLAVVEDRGGSLLVSAAAGSGKTKVLVERLFRRVLEERCNVDDFLIITYTRAAAAELRGKIAAELSKRLADDPSNRHLKRQLLRVYQADIKTVDAFCTALVRENTHLLDREGEEHALTPDFRVLDDGEAKLLRVQVLGRVLETFYADMDESGRQLAGTLGAGRDDRALEELVLEVYDKLQSHADPGGWLRENQRIWMDLTGTFDETPYAKELLDTVRRKAGHWAALLERGAESVEFDEALAKGYGEKFYVAAEGFRELEHVDNWAAAAVAAEAVTFPRLTTPKGRKDDGDVVTMKNIWDAAKNSLKKLLGWLRVDGDQAMEDLRCMAPAMVALLDLTERFGQAYRREKLRMNIADFSDQEHLALELLVREGAPTPLGEQVAARYLEIMVDEYQDTNEVQNAIFQAVSRRGENIFCVGDVKQSIYRFRLADPTIFLKKYNAYPFANQAQIGQARKILLTKNFRSRQQVLDAANFVFANILSREMGEMDYGEDEALHFGADYYPLRDDCSTEFHLIAVGEKADNGQRSVKRAEAESWFVARRIRKMLEEQYPVTGEDGTLRPCQPEDFVILMRAPGSRVQLYAEALSQQRIPCSFEENNDFFHTMEISVMLALLELVDNPRQDVPLIAALRSPLFGFTPDRLAEIRVADRKGEFYDALLADGGADCAAFLSELETLRVAARDMSAYRLVWHIYNRLNVLGVFGAMDGGAMRRENLIALSRHAEKLEANGYCGLFAFVTQLRRMLEADQVPPTRSAAAMSGVRLMSIHKSKGLEFPIVFLTDLDHAFSRQDFDTAVLVHPQMGVGPHCVDLERKIKYPTLARLALEEKLRRENLSEEQRVLYVAMTRPKEKLILVDAMRYAEKRLQRLSAMASCPVLPESVAEGKNFGDWLLLPLLCRPEAEVLRELAGAEVQGLLSGGSSPWQVFVHDAETLRPQRYTVNGKESALSNDVMFDPALLEYQYPYQRGALVPAKVTATQFKGRLLDEEIAEDAPRTPYIRPLTQPKFCQIRRGLTAAERGTATHLVLQYLDFANLDAAGQVEQLRQRELLTAEQAAAVDIPAMDRFLRSDLAREICGSETVLREYRFTLLVDARICDPTAPEGDQVLLQGVVDCCFETAEGLTVVDFKTDHLASLEDMTRRAEEYRPQLEAYTMALEQVLEKRVCRRVLYFLERGEWVEV